MTQVLGIVDIIWRGRNLQVAKGASIRPGGLKNNPVTYGRKVGRAQEYQGSEIKATVHFEAGQRWGNTWDSGEGELQVVCDTGQTFVMYDAFFSGDIPNITGGEGGSIELTWSAGTPEEIGA